MKILIIEDNFHLAQDMLQFLKNNGFVAEHAASFLKAEEKVNIYQYDLVIVDLGLPDGNGLELVRQIKTHKPDTGVLILTARDTLQDKVTGLNLGADDYMTKPFHKAELNARIHSVLRRNKYGQGNILRVGGFKIDLPAAQAFVEDTPLNLTRKEYDLLLYFMQNNERVLTKESIAEHLWGDHIDQADSFDFIYNHIKNLRKKIVNAGGKNCIRAMYGMGYKFSCQK
jgi:DNA-binding response OmpR family regulator